MPHNEQNIAAVHAGDAFEVITTVEDDDGNIIDITTAQEIEYFIKDDPFDPDEEALVMKRLSDGGVTVTDGANGEFTAKVETGDTSGLSGQKFHRARLIDSDGDRSTVFTGRVTFEV